LIQLNATEIVAQAAREAKQLEQESAEFLRECYLQGMQVMIDNTPQGEHGDLISAWKINIGDKPDLDSPKKRGVHRQGAGIGAARGELAKLKVGDQVWITNTDFKATWFEHGLPFKSSLGPRIGARRMAEKGVAAINGKVSR